MEYTRAKSATEPLIHTHGFVVSPETGEIFESKPSVLDGPSDYETGTGRLPALKPTLTPEQQEDALRLLTPANDVSSDSPPERNVVALKRVTRPPTVLVNLVHRHIALADVQPDLKMYDLPQQNWVEDYVVGACYVVAGDSKGRLNVNPAHVYAAVKLPAISTAAVEKLTGMSKSQVALIAQCARFALKGMLMYLERNPQVRDSLRVEVDFVDAYYAQELEAAI